MANAYQLAMLKSDLQSWNIWRTPISSSPEFMPEDIDLREANLNGAKLVGAELYAADLKQANLSGAKLFKANLRSANLYGANLVGADLDHAHLHEINLSGANLSGARLSNAILYGANLKEANLSEANLNKANFIRASLTKVNALKAKLNRSSFLAASLDHADLSDADLSETDLRSADLTGARLIRTNLAESNLLNAQVGNTFFGSLDLSNVKRLEDVIHNAPSIIGIDTIAKSRGKIHRAFLRGCGLSDWEIEQVKLYNPDLSNDEIINIQYRIYDLRATQALQISPLFISYSHEDKDFVDKVERQLNKKGIRFWRDIHDMKAGRMEKQIDQAIRQNPTVLMVLSEHSLNSDWVEREARAAREMEKDMGHDVLCPVALDDSWKDSKWEKHLMEQVTKYHVLDFSEWEDDVKFEGMFCRLIDGLQLFYKR